MNRLTFIFILIVTTFPFTPARAATAPADVLAPFLDDQILGVVRIDAGKIDPKTFESWVADTLKAAKDVRAQDRDLTIKTIDEPLQEANGFLAKFRAAGGREIYALFSMSDLAAGPPPLLIPLKEGVDAEKMAGVFNVPGAPEREKSTTRVGDVLIVAREGIRNRLAAVQSDKTRQVANADLIAALEAANKSAGDAGAAFEVAFAPGPDARKAFEQLVPTLPPEIGGGATTDLTGGVRWAAISVQLPPKPVIQLVVQARDPAAAGTVDKAFRRLLDASAKTVDAQAADSKQMAPMLHAFAALISKFAPGVQGDHITMTLDEPRVAEIVVAYSKGAPSEMANEQRVRSMSNIRQLLLACVVWANERKGEWPDDLAAAVKNYNTPADALKNPVNPTAGYTYVKPPKSAKDISTRIAIFESEAMDGRRGVGYVDGHCEMVKEEDFAAAYAKQKAAGKAAEKK